MIYVNMLMLWCTAHLSGASLRPRSSSLARVGASPWNVSLNLWLSEEYINAVPVGQNWSWHRDETYYPGGEKNGGDLQMNAVINPFISGATGAVLCCLYEGSVSGRHEFKQAWNFSTSVDDYIHKQLPPGDVFGVPVYPCYISDSQSVMLCFLEKDGRHPLYRTPIRQAGIFKEQIESQKRVKLNVSFSRQDDMLRVVAEIIHDGSYHALVRTGNNSDAAFQLAVKYGSLRAGQRIVHSLKVDAALYVVFMGTASAEEVRSEICSVDHYFHTKSDDEIEAIQRLLTLGDITFLKDGRVQLKHLIQAPGRYVLFLKGVDGRFVESNNEQVVSAQELFTEGEVQWTSQPLSISDCVVLVEKTQHLRSRVVNLLQSITPSKSRMNEKKVVQIQNRTKCTNNFDVTDGELTAFICIYASMNKRRCCVYAQDRSGDAFVAQFLAFNENNTNFSRSLNVENKHSAVVLCVESSANVESRTNVFVVPPHNVTSPRPNTDSAEPVGRVGSSDQRENADAAKKQTIWPWIVCSVIASLVVVAGVQVLHRWRSKRDAAPSNEGVQPGQDAVIGQGNDPGEPEGCPDAQDAIDVQEMIEEERFGMPKIDSITTGEGDSLTQRLRVVSSMTHACEL